jgi:hypothetical protein
MVGLDAAIGAHAFQVAVGDPELQVRTAERMISAEKWKLRNTPALVMDSALG